MARSVLGIGVPATADIVPWLLRSKIQRSIDALEAEMKASPYDWEMLYLTPDMPFDVCTNKLREKKWDVVMIGRGVRITDSYTPFLERIVNAVHKELPQAKFAFNETIEKPRASVDRVLAGEDAA